MKTVSLPAALIALCFFALTVTTSVQAQVAISISPASVIVPKNTTKQFAAVVAGTSNTGVKWYVDGILGGASGTGTITTGGLYTAPSATGSHTIKITSNADPSKSAASAVTVTATVVSMSISPTSASLSAKATRQFTATITGTTNQGVQWVVDGATGGNATAGTVSTNGLYTAPPTAGSHMVTATSNADSTKTASAAVTVTASGVVVSISPTSVSVPVSTAKQFAAMVTGTTNTSVKWYVDGTLGGTTDTGTISTSGLYTAPATAGLHTVSISSNADSSRSASSAVTATATVVGIGINPTSASMSSNATKQFTATVTGTTNQGVQWSVDGVTGGNATAGTVSTGGLYLAPATAGWHTVTCASNADPTKTASAAVTVSVTAVAVSISPASVSVSANAVTQFNATVTGTTNTSVQWSVDGVMGGNATLGTVSTSGLYTAPATAGSHTVTCASNADPMKTASAAVTVSGTAVAVSISPASVSVSANAITQFNATVTGTTSTSVQWSVDGVTGGNATTGTVSTSGLYTAPATAGSHTVTATSNADSTKTSSAAVTVSVTAVAVSISPASVSVSTNAVTQFNAIVTGTTNTSVQWSVDGVMGGNATLGTVSTSGLYTAPATASSHTVTATSNADSTKSASSAVTVTATAIAVSINPASASFPSNSTQQFTATVVGATNTSVQWSVDGVTGGNATTGTVSTTGLYTAPAIAGSHTVTATSNADSKKSASSAVTVTATAIAVSISPASASVPSNSAQQFTATVVGSTNTSVQWSVDGVTGGNAVAGTVSTNGTYTAPATAGSHVVTVTSNVDSSKIASAAVTITVSGVALSISPVSASVIANVTQPFTATVTGTTNTGVKWSVDGVTGGNTTMGTISASGIYTAPAIAGTHVVKATSAADLNKSASTTVSVFDSISVDFGARSSTAWPIPSGLFGATMAYYTGWNSAGLLTQAGITGVRLYANLQSVYATQTPDWTKIDPTITTIKNAGMRPILQLVFTPSWLQPSPNPCSGVTDLYRSAPKDLSAWAKIAASYVTHMNAQFPGLVQDYEIWNEPDLAGFLCVADNSDATRRNTYFSIYAAAAPAMRAAAGNSTVHIGGPVISTPDQHSTSWIQPFVTNASLAPYIDFVSYHHYFGYNQHLTWDSGADNVYSRTQGPSRGVISTYNKVAAIVKSGRQPNPTSTPIYITEYNADSDTTVDCCRNSAQYAPVWNALFVADLLNTVYQGAQRLPGQLDYYALSNQYIGICLLGTINAAMDCSYPPSGSPSPYPQLTAYKLLASAQYLGLAGGANNANTVFPPASQAGIVVAGFYTANQDSVLLVNPTGSNISQMAVNLLNPGYAYATGTSYLLNSSNQNISSQLLSLASNGSGFTTNVDLPPYSVVGIAVSQGSSPGVSVSVAPTTAMIPTGGTQQFAATVTGASDTSVTWSVDGVNSGNSVLGTVSTSGLYTAPVTAGTHTVTATSNVDATRSASAAVTVTTAGGVVAVTINPTSLSLAANATAQFTATVTGTMNMGMQWLVDGVTGGNSTVGTVSPSGLYTAPATAGAHTVTAQSIADATKSASSQVTVTIEVGVSVRPRAASVTFTQSMQFTATVIGTPNTDVAWAVDGNDGGNANVGTIDSTGLYVPPSAAGAHTITATSSFDTTRTATAQLTVSNTDGVFTYHFDNARTGQITKETVLTLANVNSTQFGQLFAVPTDGWVIGQPLYVANVNIPSQGYHNVLYVATSHDSIYAYDADGRSTQPLWQVSFTNPATGVTTVPLADIGGKAPGNEVGISSTPVIDPVSGTLYVLAQTKENGTFPHRLHALDIKTGAEMPGSPVTINASVPGTGQGYDGNGNVPFVSQWQLQRPALLLANGTIYIGWGSHFDLTPYHGWVLAYDATTLNQVGVFCDTPNGASGGIWMSGAGPSADSAGSVYFATGNGPFNGSQAGGDEYGDSVVKLSQTQNQVVVADWFAPFNASYLESQDLDLGSGASVLLPDEAGSAAHPHLLLLAGKENRIYLLDRDNLGHFNAGSDSQIVQSIAGQLSNSKLISSPAYWNSRVYFQSQDDVVKAFSINNATLSTTAVSKGTLTFGYPGAPPVVSSNGTTNGIVWLFQRGPGTLQAYDATDLTKNLYTSPGLGTQVQFASPVIVNGKVYIGTTNQVVGYGLLP